MSFKRAMIKARLICKRNPKAINIEVHSLLNVIIVTDIRDLVIAVIDYKGGDTV